MENAVTKREKISYGLYFMGQNVFYGLIGYMTTYFTDIGITAALLQSWRWSGKCGMPSTIRSSV